jgi:hypothetical protein
MHSNRRDFVFGTPLALLALDELGSVGLGAAPAASASDIEALNFWLNGAGLPPSLIQSASAEALRNAQSRAADAGPTGNFAREPVFLHWDETQNTLIDAVDIDKKMLAPESGDAQVDLQLLRLRLNSQEQKQFESFTSGGIYVELQQGGQQQDSTPSTASSSGAAPVAMASTVFSAFFPSASGAKGKSAGGGTPSGSAPASGAAKSSSAGPPIPLQTPRDAQTLALPKGTGRGLFNTFLKDRKKTVFGQFLDMFAGSNSSSTYSQLLSIPLIATPALKAIQSLVSNLQLHGSDQAVVMQAPRVDLAATTDALSSLDGLIKPLPLRTGSYVAIPREHVALIKNDMDKYAILDGFLVPKGTKDLDLTPDMTRQTVAGVSYLSLGVKVTPTKINTNNCSANKA